MELITGMIKPALVGIANCCAPFIRQKLDFVFYEKNVQNLKTQMNKLANKKAKIVERLDLAERQHLHKPKSHVADWLNKVQTLETETSIDWEEGNWKCFMGVCVNWRSRCELNNQVQQKASDVENLIEEVQSFEVLEISTPPLAPTVEKMNIPGYMETESSNILIQKITDLLESESVKAIGVWGMGGIGKTTLVRTFNNHLQSNSMFDRVITLKISQTPDWRQIHKQIAERIGLNLTDYESEDMRVNMLSMALKKENNLLFIVDDVWAYFHLSLLGISDEASDAKCKFILTTRYQSVCAQMGIGEREQLELKPMLKDDSWKLFQATAGFVANLPALQPIAITLCDKCGGSPLAICTFASTLRGDTEKVSWNGALRALSSSDQLQVSDIFMPVFESIEFSFNRLASEDVKLCFLYCCSHDFGYTSFSELRMYAISRKLIKGRVLRDASERVKAVVEELRKSSLVVVDGYENFVSVHDVVGQVGILIASKNYGFVIKSNQQLDVHDMGFNNHPIHISYSLSELDELPKMLSCPSLLALDMQDMSFTNKPEIHEEFFAQTKKLQFLDITRIGISKIPNSLYDLIHLSTLDMRGLTKLSDISCIGKLESLEILILDDTGIEELPKELGNLVSLRMLHLINTLKLKRIAPGIFRRLRSLQELTMANSFNRWELENGDNASLSEIFGLSQLTNLHLDIFNPLSLQQNYMCTSLSNLEEFSIVVATSRNSINTERRFMKYLSLAEIPSRFGNWICKLFETCEYLKLSDSDAVETLPFLQISGFNCLTELSLSNLGLLKLVIDFRLIATGYTNHVFPCLEQLVIEDMNNLEFVSNVSSGTGVFLSKLTHIQIQNCKKLEVVFKGCMEQDLQNLTDIQIHGCDKLKTLTDVEVPNYFPKLEKIKVEDCEKLETMLTPEAEWECLETIHVSRCWNLQSIFHKSAFPRNLKHLTVEECKNLTSVSALIKRSFSSIEKIIVVHCNPGNVEYLLSTNEIDEPWNKNVFENLKVLKVRGFDGRGIFHGPISQFSLQNLAHVEIIDCHVLTSIWGSRETFALLKPLDTLTIFWCERLLLKEVFLPDGMGDEFALRVQNLVLGGFSQLTTLELFPHVSLSYVMKLEVQFCENLKYLLPRSAASIINRLAKLVLYECSQLENIILQETISNDDLKGQQTCASETNSLITNISDIWIEKCDQLNLEKLGLTYRRATGLTFKRVPQLVTLAQLQSLYIVGQRCDCIRVLKCENLEKVSCYKDAHILNYYGYLIIHDCPKLLTFIGDEELIHSRSTQRQGQLDPTIKPAPTQSIFWNLIFLFIGDCHNLKNLFSFSIAGSLVYLEYIYVVNCEEMREIVAISDLVESEAYYADLFPRLKTVRLFWLPKVECFCRGNPTLMWPSLEHLYVWESSNLITLGMGPSSAPNLQQIMGKDEWFHNFEKHSSFYSRLNSRFSTMTLSVARKVCTSFDRWIYSKAYASKLEKKLNHREAFKGMITHLQLC